MNHILIAAILPAIILIWLIYRRDKYQPEPVGQLCKGFFWGILSAVIAVILALPISLVWGESQGSILDCFYQSFCCAAIPEECAKALCLYWFLRKNKHFDEYMDGIVYAVAIGMGFAGIENVLYLFSNVDQWVTLGLVRGLLSVPGHFAFAVFMGYYFSLWRIDGDRRSFWLMLLAPILAHGLFDFLLFYIDATEYLQIILVILFLVFLHKVRKRCSHLINLHLNNDINNTTTND